MRRKRFYEPAFLIDGPESARLAESGGSGPTGRGFGQLPGCSFVQKADAAGRETLVEERKRGRVNLGAGHSDKE